MALPELFANSSTPGTDVPVGILAAAITTAPAPLTVGTISTAGPVGPTDLRATGQFRIRIDTELMIVTANQTTSVWTVVRGAENTTPATHTNGSSIYHPLTKGALANVPPQSKVLTSELNALGSVSGTITPDLSLGHVASFTATGTVKIKKPTNWPTGSVVTYVEYRWKQDATGGRKVELEIDGWEGEPLPFSEAANAPNSVVLLSADNGTTILALGGEAAGLSKKEVEEIVADKIAELPATLTKAVVEEIADARIGVARVAKRLAAHVINSGVSATAGLNTANRITKAGTYALPASSDIAEDDDRVLIENASTGIVTLTGNVGGNTVAITMGPGDVALFSSNVTAAEVISGSAFWTLEAFTGAQPVVYTGLTLVGAKAEAGTGFAPGAHLEAGAGRVSLRGVIKASKAIAAAAKFATLPSSLMFPTSIVLLAPRNASTGAAIPVTLNLSGELKPVAEVAEGVEMSFDAMAPIARV